MTDRYDSLSPRDLIVTLRSLPRRFDSVHGAATRTPELVALIDAPGPDGASVGSLANEAARTLAVLGSAISTVVRSTEPVISAGVLDRAERVAHEGAPMTVKNAVGLISDEAPAIADQLDGVSADDWDRSASITGGGTTDLVTLVRECVRSSIELLRSAERQTEWMQAARR